MDVLRKAARLSLVATLLATVGSALSVTGAAASATVGSAGTVAPGGTSSGMVSFTFAEDTAAALPAGGGTLTVTLADSMGVPTIHFVGQPSISASPTLGGVSITMGPALTSFTFNVASSSTIAIESLQASGVQLGADQPAAAGAITATLSGSLASAVSATTTLASPGTVGGTGSGTHLAFTTQPGGGAAGAGWAQQPVVAVQNPLNAVVTTDITTVITLSIGTNPGGGVLSCTGGNSRTVVNGIATFAGCAISAGSANPHTLVATASSGATSATSAAFLITGAGTVTHLAFVTQPGGGAAGSGWAQQPVVAVQNPLNAVVTTDITTVITLSIGTNPGGGVMACAGGNSRMVVNGVASFTGCAISAGSANPYTLVATASSGATSATSAPFLVTVVVSQVALTSATAVGNTQSGFSTSTKVVPVGSQITLRIVTSPSLAGQRLGIWIAKKTNGVWGAFSQHTSVTVGADGVAYYVYSAGSKAWLSFQTRFNGSATIAPAQAAARQARWI